jgi:uncharacterized peroxidase-related enzyme
MAYIQLPEYEDMSPRVQEQVRPMLKKRGTLGETIKLLAIREDIYFVTDGMVKAYLLAETELPYSTKERIAILISLENSCKICVDAHKGIAKMLGMTDEQVDEVLNGIENIQCKNSEKVLLRFCVRASKKDSYKMLQEDINEVKESGYSETQIIEAVAIVGYFNYINTLSNVFGLGK